VRVAQFDYIPMIPQKYAQSRHMVAGHASRKSGEESHPHTVAIWGNFLLGTSSDVTLSRHRQITVRRLANSPDSH